MPKIHELKIWPDFFDDMAGGLKRFDFRQDDRGYAVDDGLLLREYRPAVGEYSDRWMFARVTYVLRNTRVTDKLGLPPGYCILGIDVLQSAGWPPASPPGGIR